EQQAFHIDVKILVGALSEIDFAEHHAPIGKLRSHKQIKITHAKTIVRTVPKAEKGGLWRAGIGSLIAGFPETLNLDAFRNTERRLLRTSAGRRLLLCGEYCCCLSFRFLLPLLQGKRLLQLCLLCL